jgi:RNA polymerase sigma-70 factor (ECF subfamily)
MADEPGKDISHSDEELVRRSEGGDSSAFRLLVERYQQRVVHIALSVLRDPDESLDVAQDAFLKVFRNLSRFQGKSSFYTWLYRITFNLAIDRTRSRKRRKAISLDAISDESSEQQPLDVPDGSAGPGQVAGEKELEERINQAIDRLPPKHRQAVLLREIEGLSYQEIAEVAGCSVGTVMSRLHYAREKLKEKIRSYVDGRGLDG